MGEWFVEPVLIALVEARGVAGAVSGNSGGGIFIGNGNNDARCLFRRPNANLWLDFGGALGVGVFAKEIWSPELPSDRDESDILGTGRDREELPS